MTDAFAGLHRLGHGLQLSNDPPHGVLNAALDGHGIGPGGNVLEAFVDDRLRQHDAGRGAVASGVVGLGGGFFQQLGAHVLKGVGQLNFFCDRDAVGADLRGAKLLVKHHVAAARAESDFYRVSQNVDASSQGLASFFGVCQPSLRALRFS